MVRVIVRQIVILALALGFGSAFVAPRAPRLPTRFAAVEAPSKAAAAATDFNLKEYLETKRVAVEKVREFRTTLSSW